MEGTDAEEELAQKHKKERKELQAQIQKIKHAVPKGDKKKTKEAKDEIAHLEAKLDAEQEKELNDLKAKNSKADAEPLVQQMESLSAKADPDDGDEVEASKQTQAKKPSKAQRRREKKLQADREREERIQAAEEENQLTGDRHLETEKIKQLLAARGLQIHEISSDGNCLYNAINHQLKLRNIASSNESLRKQTADYMRRHPDDYLPFLGSSPEDFEKYCNDVAYTPAWGGQLELKALSHILQVPIEVIQADGPLIRLGEDFDSPPIVLLYHRHAYGLGEHYNSVEVKSKEDSFS